MKSFKKTFEFLLAAFLYLVIPHTSNAQSFSKMPDNNWWTLSNLDMDIPGSYCYNDSTVNCNKYGRLYIWVAAQQGCRLLGEGWHLPSTAEWNNLLKHFGGIYEESASDGKTSYEKLLRTQKPTFGATLAGNRNIDGTYARIEAHGFYWTATPMDDKNAGFLNFANGKKVLFLQPDMEKSRAISVRCIKNGP